MSAPMTMLIAHRGLLSGPNPDIENSPEQVEYALAGGYQAEVDTWMIDGRWFLGHDRPQYEVSFKFLKQKGLWVHCKNFAALDGMSTGGFKINYFWHDADSYTLTSRGYVWAYPSQPVSETAICVMPEWEDPDLIHIGDIQCAGFCSDFIIKIDHFLHDRRS